MSKQRLAYRNVALLNVGTFVLFRILLLGWMTRWITINRDIVPTAFFVAGSMGLFTILTMNTKLFYMILNSDFFQVLTKFQILRLIKKNDGIFLSRQVRLPPLPRAAAKSLRATSSTRTSIPCPKTSAES